MKRAALEQPWDVARQWHCSWGTKASDNSITRGAVGPGMENVMEYCGGGGGHTTRYWWAENSFLRKWHLIKELKDSER